MNYRLIEPNDNVALANIIRKNLKSYKLDIPGTAYFDKNLDCLSDYYLSSPKRDYFVVYDEQNRIVGGVGIAEIDFWPETAELQKLYLSDSVKGQGLSYDLINLVEKEAQKKGYKKMYLETHSNLIVAIHLYEKCGYTQIERPKEVVHSTMNRFYTKNLKQTE